MGRPRSALSVAAATNTFAWGMYYSFTRRYIVEGLGGGSSSTVMLSGLEWGMSAASLAAGSVGRALGQRVAAGIGALSAAPILASGLANSPTTFALVISLSSLLWGLSWPHVLSAAFRGANGRYGRAYGRFAIGTGLGFGLGSAASGLLYDFAGKWAVLAAISVALAASYCLAASRYPDGPNNGEGIGGGLASSRLAALLASIALGAFARELTLAMASAKLNEDVDAVFRGVWPGGRHLLYGVFYGLLGSLISPLARLAAGEAVDAAGPLKVYSASVASYAAFYWAFMHTSGWTSIALWLIPIYPFMDTAIYSRVASEEGEGGTAFGYVISATSAGGLMLIPAYLAAPNAALAGVLVTASAASSVLLMAASSKPARPAE